jgi:oxygen-independent coproporphyrinogen-3 oxidase
MRELMEVTGRHFRLLDDDSGEYSIEIDPREASAETVAVLRGIGFNRMSLGVQDFDPSVQKAVNRIQTEAETLEVLEAARQRGFRSISIDLIYGLPFQSVESFGPDRLSVFNYAHLPERFKPQRRINADELPEPQEKLDILEMTGERLAAAGYVYIGMDHFARPDDELAVAQRDGSLYRNFQGYSTHADCDLIGIGVTSIGMVGPTYAQNLKTLEEYYARIDAGELGVFRGLELSRDDRLRRDVITRLICHFTLRFADVERRWGIVFHQYFAEELVRLRGMEDDGLVAVRDTGVDVLPKGRLLIRNVCMAFDAYLNAEQPVRGFSRVI